MFNDNFTIDEVKKHPNGIEVWLQNKLIVGHYLLIDSNLNLQNLSAGRRINLRSNSYKILSSKPEDNNAVTRLVQEAIINQPIVTYLD